LFLNLSLNLNLSFLPPMEAPSKPGPMDPDLYFRGYHIAMTLNQSAKEEIKRRADIVELIGQHVQLRKAGRHFVGLCPFHAEKAPSFTVSPEKQMFHCFGCKKGGDIFAFWMEYHSSTFPEALRDLGERYNVEITDRPYSAEEKRRAEGREALFQVNELAAAYFKKALKDPVKGKPGKAYLEARGLSDRAIDEFALGYAPDEWDGLLGFLKGRRIKMEAAASAGLVIPKKSGGYYDRFRGRVIFPIHNLREQVVGFGGRVLGDALPKYLNSPESPVFRKGETLYCLHSSRKDIRTEGRAVVVEGYMDLLALNAHGVEGVVATLGTALTADHIRRLKGYAGEAVVVFDSDEAGKAAVLRSLPLFLNEGMTARAVALPEGQDPDDFVNRHGAEGFLERVRLASPMFDFYLEQKLTFDDADVEGKVRVLKEILPVLGRLTNTAQRSLYVRRLSERLHIGEASIWSELKKSTDRGGEASAPGRIKQRLDVARVEKTFHRELRLLNLIVHYPEALERLAGSNWEIFLSDADVLGIVKAFFRAFPGERPFSPERLMESLDSDSAREKFREALLLPPLDSENTVDLAITELEHKIRQIQLAASIKEAKARGDLEGLNQLLKKKAREINRPSS